MLVEIHEFLMYKGFFNEVNEVILKHNFRFKNNNGITYLFEKN